MKNTYKKAIQQRVTNIATLVTKWEKFSQINWVECFYPGVRADFATFCGVAPNNEAFHASFDRICFCQGVIITASVPWHD